MVIMQKHWSKGVPLLEGLWMEEFGVNFFCRISEGNDDSCLSPAGAIKCLIQHSQGLSCSGAACSLPHRSPEAIIHVEWSTVGSAIYHQVSWWAEHNGPPTNGSTIQISSSKGEIRLPRLRMMTLGISICIDHSVFSCVDFFSSSSHTSTARCSRWSGFIFVH